jgi:membrane-bound ClpP family serine protease
MLTATILTILGLILIFSEFFLPGIILGVMGGLLILAGIFCLAVQKIALSVILIFISIVSVCVFLVVKLALKKVRKSKDIYLQDDQHGFQASSFDKDLIGKPAVAATDLRPSGHINVGDEYYSAVSKKDYIRKGEKIKIVSGEGSHLIVQLLKKEKKNG